MTHVWPVAEQPGPSASVSSGDSEHRRRGPAPLGGHRGWNPPRRPVRFREMLPPAPLGSAVDRAGARLANLTDPNLSTLPVRTPNQFKRLLSVSSSTLSTELKANLTEPNPSTLPIRKVKPRVKRRAAPAKHSPGSNGPLGPAPLPAERRRRKIPRELRFPAGSDGPAAAIADRIHRAALQARQAATARRRRGPWLGLAGRLSEATGPPAAAAVDGKTRGRVSSGTHFPLSFSLVSHCHCH